MVSACDWCSGTLGVAFYNVQHRSVGAAISRPQAIDNRPYSDPSCYAERWGQRPLHKINAICPFPGRRKLHSVCALGHVVIS